MRIILSDKEKESIKNSNEEILRSFGLDKKSVLKKKKKKKKSHLFMVTNHGS